MNQPTCVNCHISFDFTDHFPHTLSSCPHRVCRACANGCEGDFVCPSDGVTSQIVKRRTTAMRTDGSRKILQNRNEETSILKSNNNNDALNEYGNLDGPNLLDDTQKFNESSSSQARKKRMGTEDSAREGPALGALAGGALGMDGARSQRNSEVLTARNRPLNRCDIHPDQFLDVICKHPKCQKYVCLECVAFGNHSVGSPGTQSGQRRRVFQRNRPNRGLLRRGPGGHPDPERPGAEPGQNQVENR